LIQNQIELLDQEIDCSDLRNKSRILESRLRLLGQILENSEQFIAVQELMQALNLRVVAEIQAPNEQALEYCLDQCDSIADQLDSFATQGWNISEFETIYQELLDNLGQLQDKLDS